MLRNIPEKWRAQFKISATASNLYIEFNFSVWNCGPPNYAIRPTAHVADLKPSVAFPVSMKFKGMEI